jgi:CBS domain-containing protein
MKVRQMMTPQVFTIRREMTVAEAARAMVDQKIGCILVVDLHGRLRGIVTQTDFAADQHGVPFSMEDVLQKFSHPITPETLEQARREACNTMVEKIMVTEVITGTEDSALDEMARLMLRYDIDHIPIVRDGVPVGIVARHDFLRLIAEDRMASREPPIQPA